MDNDDDDYMDEDKYIQKQLNNNLDKILSHITIFLKKCNLYKLSEDEINNLMYKHPIYKYRDRVNDFVNKINNSENIKEKVIEIQEKSELRQKRKKDVEELKNFININKDILTDNNENNKKLLLPPAEEEKEKKEKNNENKNDENNKVDDILVEDTKDIEQKLLSKKRKKEKEKEKKNKKSEKNYIYINCYICKHKLGINDVHEHYGNLCKKCGDYNYSFRTMKLDFSGRIAIVTGGRIKIGLEIVKKLLSYGCKVITTSRFPKHTLFIYKEDPDYEIWKNNLIIYPIDFRFIESTVNFVNFIKTKFSHIDILINNAAQTIRRTTDYYKDLLPIEKKELNKEDDKKIIKADFLSLEKQLSEDFSEKKEMTNSLESLIKTNKTEYKEIWPLSVLASQLKIMEEKEQPKLYLIGGDGQPYDFSKGKNSWNFEIDEIPFQEFLEVQLINCWTPYYLCSKLKPLMITSPFEDRYIVNVTAVEGIFNHFKKSTHVHTNMAKASLNMLTRTCGKYFEKDKIYMTCVDTGWVSSMGEVNKMIDNDTKEKAENEMELVPLDELDGAMRVLHPIIEGIKNKKYYSGILLKDYVKSKW